MKYFAIFDKKCCDNISIAMKDWKYFWHGSARSCAMWGPLYKGSSPVTTSLVTGASCHTTFNCMKSDIQTQLNKNISLL